jgi:hypothetical protein
MISLKTYLTERFRYLFRRQSAAFMMALLSSCATLFTACAPSSREAEAQAADAVKRLGGTISHVGEAQGEAVGKIDLTDRPVSDDDLIALNAFTDLYSLSLRRTRITDAAWHT